jgi:hypothetical protein
MPEYVEQPDGSISRASSAFKRARPDGRIEGSTSVTEHEAVLILQRILALASRTAVGDGLPRAAVAEILRSEAYAIETQDVAEDTSPIFIHMA